MKEDFFLKIKEYLKRKRKDSSKIILNPQRDWFVVLVIFIFLVIVVSIYSVSFFLQINNYDDIFTIEKKEQQIEFVNRDELLNIVETYQQKEQKFEALKNNRPKFVDPSS